MDSHSRYISSTTLDGTKPIFVVDGFKVFLLFGQEIVEVCLDASYGFPLPAVAFVNCYFGSIHIVQIVNH